MSLCPSAPATSPDGQVFGVVTAPGGPRAVVFLATPTRLTPELVDQLGGEPLGGVLRVAAPCAASLCQHHREGACTLAQRVVTQLAPVVDRPPPCPIRASCLWWAQEQSAACLRCPRVVTSPDQPSDQLRDLAAPGGVDDAA